MLGSPEVESFPHLQVEVARPGPILHIWTIRAIAIANNERMDIFKGIKEVLISDNQSQRNRGWPTSETPKKGGVERLRN